MRTTEIVEHLRKLSIAERLEVIEAASRLIREDFSARNAQEPEVEDHLLRVAGCLSGNPLSAAEIEKELYGEDSR